MSLTTNIVRRGMKYYVRLAVPKPLWQVVKKREIWKSLGTADPVRAKTLARQFIDDVQNEWNNLLNSHVLAPTDVEEIIWERYSSLIESDERFRIELPTSQELDEIWQHLEEEFGEYDINAFRVLEGIQSAFDEERNARTARLSTLRADISRGEISSVSDLLKQVMAARQLVGVNRTEEKRLAQGMQRAEIEALSRAAERDKGDFSGVPRDAIVRPPITKRSAAVPATETIMGVFDRFQREKPGSLSADTWVQNRKIIELLAEFAGKLRNVNELTRKVVRDWKEQLFQWPSKAAEIAAFRGLSFNEVVKLNATIGKSTISERTINKYLSAVGGFANFLVANDFVKEDLMKGMFLDLDRSEKKVFPFSDDQLNLIFTSPLYSGCQGTGKESTPGAILIRDWRFWIPLISLFSGARLGEIAQLELNDIKSLHGHWCFHITEEGISGKAVKTRGSERIIPIHPELLRIGLMGHHSFISQKGSGRLFPELKVDARGFISGKPSKFFNAYFRRIGAKNGKSNNFHSFRHGIADAFRQAGFMDEQFGVLLGHTRATTTQRYGIVPEGDLATRVRMIKAVKFPNLNLAFLC